MRRGECLVKIDMHHVKAHVARTSYAKHRIEIRTVIIHQRTRLMHHLGYLLHAMLEHAGRIGVGHHHGRHRIVKQRTQGLYVNRAVREALHLHHFQTGHCSRRRVCAMSRIRHDHLHPLAVATRLMIGAYHHQAC